MIFKVHRSIIFQSPQTYIPKMIVIVEKVEFVPWDNSWTLVSGHGRQCITPGGSHVTHEDPHAETELHVLAWPIRINLYVLRFALPLEELSKDWLNRACTTYAASENNRAGSEWLNMISNTLH
jgi:hypothetical protein